MLNDTTMKLPQFVTMTVTMKKIISTIFVSVFILFATTMSAHAMERIALIVNDTAITEHDIQSRMKMIMASSGLPNTDDVRAKIVPQIVKSLIEEQLKLQEAERLDIVINESDVKKGFAQVAQNNKMSAEKFEKALKGAGIDVRSIERQIQAQIAWSQVVQKRLKPQVFVSDGDIEDARARLAGAQGKTEYLLGEIFLPVNDPSDEADVKKAMNSLAKQAKSKNGSFYKLAQQFSKAAGAAQGGNVGWVQEGQLDEVLDEALVSLEKSQISNPIRSADGYHLFLMRDRRVVDAETLPSEAQIQYDLGIKRLERLERRYHMDLRAAAFIEQRA